MAEKKQRKPQYILPAMEVLWGHVHKPDTHFAAAGEAGAYKVDMVATAAVLDQPVVINDGRGSKKGPSLRKFLDDGVDASVEQAGSDNPKLRKQIKRKPAYTPELDGEGDETGRFIIRTKQNAEIKRRDGTVVKVTIPVFDKSGNAIDNPIFRGAIVQVAVTTRETWMAGNKEAGLRLDLKAVRAIKLTESERTAGSFGFDVEDGEDDYEDVEDMQSGAEGGDDSEENEDF